MVKKYAFYVNLEAKKLENKVVVIKEGFYFMAGFLHIFWTIANFLIIPTISIFSLFVLIAILKINGFIDDVAMLICQIGIIIYSGINASDWLSNKLLKNNYQLYCFIFARNEEEAEQKFFEKYQNILTNNINKNIESNVTDSPNNEVIEAK